VPGGSGLKISSATASIARLPVCSPCLCSMVRVSRRIHLEGRAVLTFQARPNESLRCLISFLTSFPLSGRFSRMADDASTPRESFNLEKLRELIELMEKHDLTDVHLRHGEEQWRLRRGPQVVAGPAPAPAPAVPPPPAAAPAPAPATPAESVESPRPVSNLVDVKSPIVGTFYSSPSPDDPAFVTQGSRVTPDTVVCIVEAMKVFNQITADVSGTIEEILVANGDPVESGQVLYRVRPN